MFPYFVVEKGAPSCPWSCTSQELLPAVAPLESSSLQMAVLRLSLLQNNFKPSWWVCAVRQHVGLAQGATCECDILIPSSSQRSQSCHPHPHLPILGPVLLCIGMREKSQAKGLNWLRNTIGKRPISYQFSLWIQKRKPIYLKVYKTN